MFKVSTEANSCAFPESITLTFMHSLIGFEFRSNLLKMFTNWEVSGDLWMALCYSMNAGWVVVTFWGGGDTQTMLAVIEFIWTFFVPNLVVLPARDPSHLVKLSLPNILIIRGGSRFFSDVERGRVLSNFLFGQFPEKSLRMKKACMVSDNLTCSFVCQIRLRDPVNSNRSITVTTSWL